MEFYYNFQHFVQIKESKCVNGGHSLNGDFTVKSPIRNPTEDLIVCMIPTSSKVVTSQVCFLFLQGSDCCRYSVVNKGHDIINSQWVSTVPGRRVGRKCERRLKEVIMRRISGRLNAAGSLLGVQSPPMSRRTFLPRCGQSVGRRRSKRHRWIIQSAYQT